MSAKKRSTLMWEAIVLWWKELCRMGELRAQYLRERDAIVCAHAWGDLDGDYDVAMEDLKERYVALGLTIEDITRTDAYHPWVRVE